MRFLLPAAGITFVLHSPFEAHFTRLRPAGGVLKLLEILADVESPIFVRAIVGEGLFGLFRLVLRLHFPASYLRVLFCHGEFFVVGRENIDFQIIIFNF